MRYLQQCLLQVDKPADTTGHVGSSLSDYSIVIRSDKESQSNSLFNTTLTAFK